MLVLGGPDAYDEFAVLDAKTGKARWRLRDDDELPGAAGKRAVIDEESRPRGTGDTVLLPYTTECDDCDEEQDPEFGLAAVSADGEAEWTRKLTAGEEEHWLMAADDRLALSVVGDKFPENPADLRVLATDIADGSERWTAAGWWPHSIAGDTVLGVRAESRMDVELHTESTVVAADIGTGKIRWDLAKSFKRSRLLAVADGAVVVRVRDGQEDDRTLILDLDSGRQVDELGTADECVADRAFIACIDDSAESPFFLRTYDVRERKAAKLDPWMMDPSIAAVWGDYIATNGPTGGWTILDRAGRLIGRGPHENLKSMSADLAVVTTDRYADHGPFAVLPIR